MEASLKEKIQKRTQEIEEVIYHFLPEETGYQKTVLSAMNYTMKAGGKRLRPMLMEETFRLFGGTDRTYVAPFMAAIEMIHTYSLIHDDLPALDNDAYRRGKKTAHVVYGEAMAILAGDALLNYAFETAAKAFDGTPRDIVTARAFRILCTKPGIYGMIGGQTADVEAEHQEIPFEELLFIHEKKTAALIECAMMIGAILGGASEEEVSVVEEIARKTGLAFQIQDDILDVTGDASVTGKAAGSDEKNQKTTYVTLEGLSKARKEVEALSAAAIGDLDKLPGNNEFLEQLIRLLVNRER